MAKRKATPDFTPSTTVTSRINVQLDALAQWIAEDAPTALPEHHNLAKAATAFFNLAKGYIANGWMNSAMQAAMGATGCVVQLAIETSNAKLLRIARNVASGGKRGHEYTHGTREQREADYRKWQSELESKLTSNPQLSVTEARRRIAKLHAVCLKTVARNTVNPRAK